MDMQKLFVVDGKGLRTLLLREGLRLFGYPENFKFNVSTAEGYDLLGNTVTVPVIEEISKRFINVSLSKLESPVLMNLQNTMFTVATILK